MQKLSKSQIKRIRLLGLSLILIPVLYLFFQIHELNVASSTDQLKVTLDGPKDYLNLFQINDPGHLKLNNTYSSLTRDPISFFTYKDSLNIVVYKFINYDGNGNLDNDIRLINNKSTKGKSVYYTIDRSYTDYKIVFKSEQPKFGNSIYLLTEGNLFKKVLKMIVQ